MYLLYEVSSPPQSGFQFGFQLPVQFDRFSTRFGTSLFVRNHFWLELLELLFKSFHNLIEWSVEGYSGPFKPHEI